MLDRFIENKTESEMTMIAYRDFYEGNIPKAENVEGTDVISEAGIGAVD